MLKSPMRITIFLFTFIFTVLCFAQEKKEFSKKQECYTIFKKANSKLKEKNDTTGHHDFFKQIDALILKENSHEYFVKYRAFRGTILCMHGFFEGIKYNHEAVKYGEENLDSLSKFLANAYGNLGVSYHMKGNTEAFIKYTTLSNNILVSEPKKNAASIMQINFNFEIYFVDDPDGFKHFEEQNDSLVNYLLDEDLDIKALYYIKKGLKNIQDKNIQEAKKHIGMAFEYYNADSDIKPNIIKSYFRALATYYYLTKDYKKAIENFKIYAQAIKHRKAYTANTFLYNQIASSFKALNQLDSSLYYSRVSYDFAVEAHMHKKGSYNKFNLPNQCIELLKLQKEVNHKYDNKIFEVLKQHSDSIKIQPTKYLEFLKIQDEINKDSDRYISYLKSRITEDNIPTTRAYYYKKYGQYYLEQTEFALADSMFDLSITENKVNRLNTNTTFHNYNLLKDVTLEKHKIFNIVKAQNSAEITLKHYEKTLKNLVSYVYENWDGVDKESILHKIAEISNEAVEFCFNNQNSNSDIPFAKYALYFSDQGNSILYKYNKRRIESLNGSQISEKEGKRLKFLRGRIDDFLYGQHTTISQNDLIPFQNEYNGLILKAESESEAIIKLQNFESFDKQISNLEASYDCILALHVAQNTIYKITEENGKYTISKLEDSFNSFKRNQEQVIEAMISGDSKSFSKHSHGLYLKLFQNKKSIENKHILIVNSPKLITFPFECLINNPAKKDDNFNTFSYLIHHTQFVYTPGLSSDYDHEKNSDLVLPYVGIYSVTKNNLNFAKKEIENVNHLLNGKFYNAQTIDKSKLEEQLKQARIIHIASHNSIDTANAYSSELVLSDSSEENYKLYQIMNMDINPDLLILNACSTANGKYKKGEGKMSMARAFNYAGAKNVIVNSWDVSDYSVSEIMKSFFKYYPKKYSVNKALNQAKIDYLAQSDNLTANPLYWAGTIFVSTNIVNHESNFILLFASILLLSLLIIGISLKSSSKKTA